MSTFTEENFRKIVDNNPRLCAWGWWNPIQGRQMKINLEGDRAVLLLRFEEFRRSVEWLSQCQTTKTASASSPNSYNLKHRAERATGDYIDNGALIAAAIYLRIPIKYFDDTPNPAIGVSLKCPIYRAAER